MLNLEPLSASDVLHCGKSKDMSEKELRQRRKLELNSLLLDILFSHVPPNVDSTVDRLLQHGNADNFVEVCAEACRWRLTRCASAVRPHMWRVVIALARRLDTKQQLDDFGKYLGFDTLLSPGWEKNSDEARLFKAVFSLTRGVECVTALLQRNSLEPTKRCRDDEREIEEDAPCSTLRFGVTPQTLKHWFMVANEPNRDGVKQKTKKPVTVQVFKRNPQGNATTYEVELDDPPTPSTLSHSDQE